jgi:hypothetical protein
MHVEASEFLGLIRPSRILSKLVHSKIYQRKDIAIIDMVINLLEGGSFKEGGLP